MKKIFLPYLICAVIFLIATGCDKEVKCPKPSTVTTTAKTTSATTTTATTNTDSNSGHDCGNHSSGDY